MSGNDDAEAVDDRIASIKTAMALPNDDAKSYWRDPKMQEEYTRLIAAKQGRRDDAPAGAR